MKPTLLLIAMMPASGLGDSFPLGAGNQWLYRGAGALQQVEVIRVREVDQKTYFVVQGISGGDLLVRLSDDNTVLIHEAEQGPEKVWVRLNADEGESYLSGIESCPRTATIVSRRAPYSGPVGTFENAIEIAYSGSDCGPVSLRKETFVPGVGLVQRTTSAPAGDLTVDLIYASIHGLATLSEREIRFALTLDRAVYFLEPGDPIRTLNATPKAIPQYMTAQLPGRV